MSLFSSSLVSNRGAIGNVTLYGGSDSEFKAEFNKEMMLTRFATKAEAALEVAEHPAQKLKDFKAALAPKEATWLARYKSVKGEYDKLGFPSDEAHQRALSSAKSLAEQDISIVAEQFPYILDDGALVNFAAKFQAVPTKKSSSEDKK